MRRVSVAATMIVTVVVSATYPTLPHRVPTHLGWSTAPDEYGPRWSVLILAAVFTLLVLAVQWLAGKPQWFNYPMPVTADNAQALYREGEAMMAWLGLALTVVYGGIVMAVHELPGGYLFIPGVAMLLGTAVIGVWRMGRAGRRRQTYVRSDR